MLTMPRLRRLAVACDGVSAMEFALIASFFMAPLIIGIFDFSTALYRWMEVGNAARAGAQYINANGYSSSYATSGGTCSASGNGFGCAIRQASNLGGSVNVAVGNPYCGCQDGATYTAQSISPPCTTCPNGGTTPVTLAQVTASYTYYPAFPYFGYGPNSGFNLSASATALLY